MSDKLAKNLLVVGLGFFLAAVVVFILSVLVYAWTYTQCPPVVGKIMLSLVLVGILVLLAAFVRAFYVDWLKE